MSHISGAMLLSPTPIVRKRWRLSDRLYFHTFSDDPLWLVGFYILILMLWSDVRVLFSVIHSPFLDSQKKRKSIVTVLLSKDPSRKEKKCRVFFTYCVPPPNLSSHLPCHFQPLKTRQFQLGSTDLRDGHVLKVNVSVPNTRLFVGNIPKTKSREDIIDEFGKLSGKLYPLCWARLWRFLLVVSSSFFPYFFYDSKNSHFFPWSSHWVCGPCAVFEVYILYFLVLIHLINL